MHAQPRDSREARRMLKQAEECFRAGRLNQAEVLFERIAAAGADGSDASYDAWTLAVFRLALIAGRTGRFLEAINGYGRILTSGAEGEGGRHLDPDLGFICNANAATLFRRAHLLPMAEKCCLDALEIREEPRVLVCLASALLAMRRREEAIDAATAAIQLDPDQFAARWIHCMARLPLAYCSASEVVEVRRRYASALNVLAETVGSFSTARRRAASNAVGLAFPFFLPYQGFNDRALQRVYGRAVWQLMSARLPRHARHLPPRRKLAGRRIRVGIVSPYIGLSKLAWRMPVGSWVSKINRDRFELFGYFTTPGREPVEGAESLFSVFRAGLSDIAHWADAISQDRLDILIYPEVSTDETSLRLAALRLAPFQATTFAHALTSGLPTMDAVFSGDLIEAPGGGSEYTEEVIALPNLGFTMDPPTAEAEPVARSDLGIAENDVVFWCGQSLYKYHPADDHIYAEIAARVPNARFLFHGKVGGEPAKVFEERMADAFLAQGLAAQDFCVFEHTAKKGRYYGLCRLADIGLDTPRWSGLATSVDLLDLGRPVLTLPGDLARSRFTAAILTMIGVTETIATDKGAYVGMAAGLARDPDRLGRIRSRIASSKSRLYGDMTPIAALETVLCERAATAAGN